MKRIILTLAIGFIIQMQLGFASAQQPAKIPRIGYVSGTGSATNQGPYVEALRQGMREFGYAEGKHFVIEYRGAEGKRDRIAALV
ncbi:MAG: transporter substrate-binding protein, partial [Deltaproteobacteria bacterium]|nr:transporter substrate-binding protein [Deltaproteobacteria bacterium]